MKRNFGFTLLELMIVVAVVAVLVALAVPSYVNYIRKANRGEAQALLLEWANNQEVWRASNASYDDGTNIDEPTHDRFGFAVSNTTASTYTLTATANTTGGQNLDEERNVLCNVMTVNQLGQKTPPECWQQ